MNAKSANRFMFFMLLYQIAATFALQVILMLPGISLSVWQLLIIGEPICFIIPCVVYLLLSRRSFKDVFSIKHLGMTNALLIFFMMIAFQPLMMFLSALSMLFFHNNVASVMQEIYSIPLPLLLLTLAVTPAICEEAAFRGIIQSSTRNVPLFQAAALNGFLFGLMHLDPQQFLYAFVLGAIFYILVYYSGSIFASVLAHFTVNGTQAMLAFLSLKYLETAEQTEIASSIPIDEHYAGLIYSAVLSLLSAPFLLLLFYIFVKRNKKSKLNVNEQTDNPVDIFLILTVILYLVYIAFTI